MKNRTRVLMLGVMLTFVFGVGRGFAGETVVSGQQQAVHYVCTMCEGVVSDKPGNCPHCGMKLVPVDEKGNAAVK